MNQLILMTALAVAAPALGACATHSAAQPRPAPIGDSGVPSRQAEQGGPPSRVVELPAAPREGEPREVSVLVDGPALKLARIVLRGGTVLPTHRSAVPVTILALEGSGTVVAGTERLRLDATHAVILAPNVPHAVEPDAGTDLVLLVHHLGRGAERHQ
jgi:quercetin dioxygenase-like cupin family protein